MKLKDGYRKHIKWDLQDRWWRKYGRQKSVVYRLFCVLLFWYYLLAANTPRHLQQTDHNLIQLAWRSPCHGIDFRDSTAKGPWPCWMPPGMRGKMAFCAYKQLVSPSAIPSDRLATVDCYQASGKAPCLLLTVEAKEVVHLYGEECTLMDSHGK